ncbi:sulfotransferase family protein [Octadecabacter sp. R77987]|uniref:sulfotransferase family protein n=1 Tax=Octadecabacter sp. R77987 TaxID=3093874 RepID=UPI00367062F7
MTTADASPVILIGAARSGTKFLRDVLAVSQDLAAVPYDVNYIWRYGAGDAPSDRLDPAALTPKRIGFIRAAIARIAKPEAGQRVIEKTVSNTLRVPFVDAVYPDARYVHLIRDGRDVTESAMRMWQAKPDWRALLVKLRQMPLSNIGYAVWFAGNILRGLFSGRKGGNVWGPRFDGIDQIATTRGLAAVCAWQWRNSVTQAGEDLAQIPRPRVYEIRYEDLVNDEAALRGLVDWLGLCDPDAIVATWRARVSTSQGSLWEGLPQADIDTINKILAQPLAQHGYK